VKNLLQGRQSPGGPFISIDPALNLAIDFGLGEKLIHRTRNGRIALSKSGIAAADEILDSGLLDFEKSSSTELKGLASESNLEAAMRLGRRS
jgi:hypothetical protein